MQLAGNHHIKEGLMKSIFTAIFLLASAVCAVAQQPTPTPATDKDQDKSGMTSNGYVRPSSDERRKSYLNSVFGPVTLARVAAGAAVGTFRNRPEEWEKNAEGFGRRFASGFGENAIRQSITFGLDEALRVDSGFYRSKKRDFGSKLSNALLSTITARNSKGKRVVGVPRILGTLAAPVISREAWFPERFNYRDGLRSGAISLGINAAVNLFRELIKK